MITYYELLAYTIVVIEIIRLCFAISKHNKK